ncbi:MAG: hypothetical protein BAJALOKI2v1_130027 [Promethearchaeota archaeon]|nr:MAG: hypothetical protein BAJALOKI2v1_130027 [Candidatus Lokiarchaeota archaeon]
MISYLNYSEKSFLNKIKYITQNMIYSRRCALFFVKFMAEKYHM